MNLSQLELRVAEALYESFYGDLVSSASRGLPFRSWLSGRIAHAGFEVACGVRLALFLVLLAPLFFVPGWHTFLGSDARGRGTAIGRLAEANNYAARQLLVMLKAIFALFAGHDAQFMARTHARALVTLGRKGVAR